LTLGGVAIGVIFTIMTARVITTLFYGFEPNFAAAVVVAATVLVTGCTGMSPTCSSRLADRSGRCAAARVV
jgi:hypothetical protein